MNTDDIFAALGMSGDDAAPAADLSVTEYAGTAAGGGDAPAGPTPNAVRLPAPTWARRRGRQLLDALGDGDAAASAGPLDLGDDDDATLDAATDCYAAAYEVKPELTDACTDPVRHDFFRALLESPEFAGLHANTQLDPYFSELAAAQFAGELAQMRGARRQRAAERPPGKQTPQEQGRERQADEVAAIAAAHQAATAAQKDVEDAQAAAAAAGVGEGGGGKLDGRRIGQLMKQIRQQPQLARIFEWAGRYRRLAAAKQRQKSLHGQDEVVGPTCGDDLTRLLDSELANLASGDLEDEFLLRLTQKRLGVRETRGVEPVGKGPVLVWLDESGSMSGEKIVTAKALALAMAWVARQQGRFCCLMGWSDGNQRRQLVLPPGRPSATADAELVAWLTAMWNGGTTPPLHDAEQWYAASGAPAGKTDILLVTDGEFDGSALAPAAVAAFAAWKTQRQARVIGIGIGAGKKSLGAVCDEVHIVASLGVDSDAVGRAVSI